MLDLGCNYSLIDLYASEGTVSVSDLGLAYGPIVCPSHAALG